MILLVILYSLFLLSSELLRLSFNSVRPFPVKIKMTWLASFGAKQFDKHFTNKDASITQKATELAVKTIRIYLNENRLSLSLLIFNQKIKTYCTMHCACFMQKQWQSAVNFTLFTIWHRLKRHLSLESEKFSLNGDYLWDLKKKLN